MADTDRDTRLTRLTIPTALALATGLSHSTFIRVAGSIALKEKEE